jgi:hypothetical protein
VLRDDLLIEAGRALTAPFTTPCFWSGETSLAEHGAVITTDAGWIDGEEAARVRYDADRGGCGETTCRPSAAPSSTPLPRRRSCVRCSSPMARRPVV